MGQIKKWRVKLPSLNTWFSSWYTTKEFYQKELDVPQQSQLLFPCWHFDYAKGFSTATRVLVYHINHYEEFSHNPTNDSTLYLPQRITRK